VSDVAGTHTIESCEVPAPAEHPPIQPADRLFVPYRKRMTQRYLVNDEGGKELHLHYGIKEITFDEVHLFPWGEQLAKQSSFVAHDATAWGTGHPWEEIQPLLDALLAEGILRRGDGDDDTRGGGLVPPLLPPSTCPAARSWSAADAEWITGTLGGRPVEVGYLESILSVYRIPHPALDGDLRQVGEANVFPPALRLDAETEWRVCQYSGSRYRDERPMNITALKAMIKHWKPMMTVLLDVRAELLRRISRSRDRLEPGGAAAWTVGDMHLFSAVVLSLPAYALMKKGGASPQPLLHPVLSSLFRITDGIRMTTHEMLFLSPERTRAPEEPVTAADIYSFAERNGTFLSEFGVCAGPKALIDEFLSVAFDGLRVEGADDVELSPDVRALLAELPAAVDYGLFGLQIWGITRSVWCLMSLVYKALRALFAGATGPAAARFSEMLEADWFKLDAARIAGDYDRDVHIVVYKDCYEQPYLALPHPVGPRTLEERLAPVAETDRHRAVADQLQTLLARKLADSSFAGPGDSDPAAVAATMAGLFTHYLRQEQAVLASALELQDVLNTLLDRPRPTRPLSVRDLRVNYAMYGGFIGGFPYLFDSLADVLGVHVHCTVDSIEVVDRSA
jgi:hypothetical protein